MHSSAFAFTSCLLLLSGSMSARPTPDGTSGTSGVYHVGYDRYGPPIVALGDSITELAYSSDDSGWVSMLSDAFRRRNDVFNRGYSGYQTSWYSNMTLPILKDIMALGSAPGLITFMLGTNDALSTSKAQYVPVEQYKTNLHKIYNDIRSVAPKSPLIVMSPPPCTSGSRDPSLVFQYRSALLSAFSDEKAKNNDANLVIVDTWSLFFGTGSAESFQFTRDYNEDVAASFLRDGVHFNSKGNRAFFDRLRNEILNHFPDLKPSYGVPLGFDP